MSDLTPNVTPNEFDPERISDVTPNEFQVLLSSVFQYLD